MANKNKIINQAQKHISKGQWDRAIKELNKLIAEDPEDVRTLLKLGDVYSKKGDRENATSTYKKVAESYSEQGFFLKAVAVYKQILKHDAQNLVVVLKLAELYEHLGLASEAMSQYQLAAQLHEHLGDSASSLDVLKRMVELDADNVASRIKLAEGFSREGRIPEAVEEFERAAEILKRHNRIDDYVKVAERLVYHAPERGDVVKELARLYLSRQDTKRALAKLQLCFKSEPRDIETLALLAQAFNDLGQTQKTIFVYRELSQVYLETGLPEEALRIQRAILQIDPYDADARAAVGANGAIPEPPPHLPPPLEPPEIPSSGAEFDTPDISDPVEHGNGSFYDEPLLAPSSRAPPPPPPAAPDEVEKLITETDVYIKYGLREKALEHLRLVFSIDPDCVPAYEKLRDVHLAIGDQARAAEAVANMMHVYARREDGAGLERARSQLGQLAPGHPLAQRGLPGVIPEAPEVPAESFVDEISIDITEDSSGIFESPLAAPRPPPLPETHSRPPDSVDRLPPPPPPPQDPPDLPGSASALEGIPAVSADLPSADVLSDDVLSADVLADDGADFIEDVSADPYAGQESLFEHDAGGWAIPNADLQAPGNDAEENELTDDVVLESPVVLDSSDGLVLHDEPWSSSSSPDTGSIAREAYQLPVAPTELPRQSSAPLSGDFNAFDEDGAPGWNPDEPVTPLSDPVSESDDAEPFLPGPRATHPGDDPAAESGRSAVELDAALGAPFERSPDAIVTLVPDEAQAQNPQELEDEVDEAEFLVHAGLVDEARHALAHILERAPAFERAVQLLAELDQATDGAPSEEHEDFGTPDSTGPSPLPIAPPPRSPSSEDARSLKEAEDFYDEGMAFREIGRLDEAISAFMHASKSPSRRIASLELIGHCYVEKGLFGEAIRSFLAALQSGAQGPGATNLKYEIGAAHEAEGELQNALSWFEACAADDAHHRDVSERIARVASHFTAPSNGVSSADASPEEGRPDSVKKSKISYL